MPPVPHTNFLPCHSTGLMLNTPEHERCQGMGHVTTSMPCYALMPC